MQITKKSSVWFVGRYRGSVIYAGNPFRGSDALEEIIVPEDNNLFYMIDNVLFMHDGTLLYYPPTLQNKEYTAPEGTTCLGDFVFSHCDNLEKVSFPNTLKKVMVSFEDCKNLKSIIFPESVLEFDDQDTINNCTNMQTIENRSDAPLKLRNRESFNRENGWGFIYWRNKETGKYVPSIANGIVERVEFGDPGGTAIISGVKYSVTNWNLDYTLEEMNDGVPIGTVNGEVCENDFEIKKKVKINGWIYTVEDVLPPYIEACKGLTASLYGYNDVKFSWKPANLAHGYKVYYKKSSATKYTYAGKTTGTSMKISNLAGGSTYNFKVVPYFNFNGKDYTNESIKNIYVPSSDTSKISTSLYGYNDVKLAWNKVTGAKGYKVYYKKSTASKYTYYKETSQTSMKFKDLSDGVKYSFKVVPYSAAGTADAKKTSSIYTLKKLSQPTVNKSTSTKVKVTWNNIPGETGYQISRSTSKTGTNIVSTYKTTSGNNKVITAKRGEKYYYKVRAYKVVGDKKIYAPWSTVRACTLK